MSMQSERHRGKFNRACINHEMAIWGAAARFYRMRPYWLVPTKIPFGERRLGLMRNGVPYLIAHPQWSGYVQWKEPDPAAGWAFDPYARDNMGQDLPKVRLTPEVIDAINEEFAYQETRWSGGAAPASEPSVSNRLVTLRVYLAKAEEAFANDHGDQAALDVLRKVAALALRPLIEHGCPRRVLPMGTSRDELERLSCERTITVKEATVTGIEMTDSPNSPVGVVLRGVDKDDVKPGDVAISAPKTE